MKKRLIKAACAAFAMLMLLTAAACKKNAKDDNNVTRELVEKSVEALLDYDAEGFNKNSLCKQELYNDDDGIITGCKIISDSIKWEIEDISINGNTAAANLNVTFPTDTGEICLYALNDTLAQLGGSSGASPKSLFNSALKKRSAELHSEQMTCEIAMSKIGNKWYITKADRMFDIISEIRNAVASAYSLIS